MFEKYNESARRSLFFSRYEASARNESVIDTHHFVLGVLRENDPTTSELFRALSVKPLHFQELWPPTTDRISSSAELPLSEDAKKALAYTAREAEDAAAAKVTPIHILLGVLRIPESRGGQALVNAGLTYQGVVELARAISTKSEEDRAANEQTPIVLRHSHYSLLDSLCAQVTPHRGRRTTREEVALALFDGLTANPNSFPRVSSLDELRVRMAEAIAGLPPDV